MALTLLRRRAAPRRRPESAEPPGWRADPVDLPPDDYLIEGEDLPAPVPKAARLVRALQIALVLVIAVLALAIFGLMGLMFNLL